MVNFIYGELCRNYAHCYTYTQFTQCYEMIEMLDRNVTVPVNKATLSVFPTYNNFKVKTRKKGIRLLEVTSHICLYMFVYPSDL